MVVCRHTQGTPFEPLGHEINRIGKNLLLIRDPIGLEKGLENLLVVVSDICAKMSEEERGGACELLERAKNEYYVEDKLPLIGMILSKIPNQLSLEKKLSELMISIKPKIREELVLTSGITVLGTGGQHVVTIPLQEISYTELREDWEKIKDQSMIKFANLPPRFAKRVKDYLIRNKKEDLLKQLTGGF